MIPSSCAAASVKSWTTTVGHKSPTSVIVTATAGLLILAALAPSLIALSQALLPLLVVGGIIAVVLRLVFFHTRKW